jgi:hypothetical protein
VIDAQSLTDWCGEQVAGFDMAPIAKRGPVVPQIEYPDNMVIVTMMAGSSTEMDDVVRRPAFQVKVRGLWEYYDSIALWANTIDLALMSGPWGSLWGTWVNSIEHVGGEPAPTVDNVSAKRITFDCVYIVREILQGANQ